MVYDLGYMIYKVFSVVIIRSGERGWISNHIFFTKIFFFCQNNVDSAAYSRIGSYAPGLWLSQTPVMISLIPLGADGVYREPFRYENR